MKITPEEANLLLYALDAHYKTDARGHIGKLERGYSLYQMQDLRDRLFAIHEHPKE